MFVRGIVDGKIAALERVLSREPVDGLGTSDQPEILRRASRWSKRSAGPLGGPDRGNDADGAVGQRRQMTEGAKPIR